MFLSGRILLERVYLSYRSNVLYPGLFFEFVGYCGLGNGSMSEIAPRRIAELLRIVFVRLWQEYAGLPAGDILAYIPQATRLTEYESGISPSSHIPRYEKAIRLATTPYVKSGWLVKNKGRWLLTEEGKRACKSFSSADAFYREAARIFEGWRESRSVLALVTEEAEEKAWEQIRSYLQELRPYEFQVLVGDLLTAIGYHLAWAAPPQKERGFVNFVFHSDSLGLSVPRIKVHVLHSGQPVLVEGLKAFMSVLGTEDAGIFISAGGFTGSVMEAVQEQKSFRITLIDLENFFDLWLEYYDKLTNAARQRFPLKTVYFLSPLE
jgi:restriction system protein